MKWKKARGEWRKIIKKTGFRLILKREQYNMKSRCLQDVPGWGLTEQAFTLWDKRYYEQIDGKTV